VKKKFVFSGLAAAALAISGLATALPGADASPRAGVSAATHAVRVCNAHPAPGFASCLAVALVGADGKASPPLPTGFTPDDVQAAYKLTGLKSGGRTVAIVDAHGYSGLEADLAVYRSTYGLKACTTGTGCLTIMNEHGSTTHLPADDPGWDLEQALDVDAVSATCPDCKIIVVQARSASLHALGIAVDTAASQPGVVAISNSYLGHDRNNVSDYNHPGIAITAATGDGGYNPANLYPASDPHVVAVSGTAVTKDGSARGYSETAWSGTGSGCSVNKKPSWQTKFAKTTCATRAVGDVSAAASPSLGGLIIYYNGSFRQVGGTSEATPIIGAVYALSGNTGGYPARFPYQNPKHLYDVTSGSNGSCGAPLCTAQKGWDGVTGVGTPHGVAGF